MFQKHSDWPLNIFQPIRPLQSSYRNFLQEILCTGPGKKLEVAKSYQNDFILIWRK